MIAAGHRMALVLLSVASGLLHEGPEMRTDSSPPYDRSEASGLAPRAERGFSAAELLVVLALLSLALLAGSAAWNNFRRKAEVGQAARLVKTFLYRARMLSVYQGTGHFVVIDPAGKTVAIFRDSSAPTGKFNTGDVRVISEAIPPGCSLALPSVPSPLPNPLGGTDVANAWSLPFPDTSAAWGSGLRGVLATTSGTIQSGESSPQTIVSGVMVFTDGDGQTSAVGVRGQAGNVRAFELLASGWKEL